MIEAFGARNCVGTYAATPAEGMIHFDLAQAALAEGGGEKGEGGGARRRGRPRSGRNGPRPDPPRLAEVCRGVLTPRCVRAQAAMQPQLAIDLVQTVYPEVERRLRDASERVSRHLPSSAETAPSTAAPVPLHHGRFAPEGRLHLRRFHVGRRVRARAAEGKRDEQPRPCRAGRRRGRRRRKGAVLSLLTTDLRSLFGDEPSPATIRSSGTPLTTSSRAVRPCPAAAAARPTASRRRTRAARTARRTHRRRSTSTGPQSQMRNALIASKRSRRHVFGCTTQPYSSRVRLHSELVCSCETQGCSARDDSYCRSSKLAGEAAVLAADPSALVLRTNVVYGRREDNPRRGVPRSIHANLPGVFA